MDGRKGRLSRQLGAAALLLAGSGTVCLSAEFDGKADRLGCTGADRDAHQRTGRDASGLFGPGSADVACTRPGDTGDGGRHLLGRPGQDAPLFVAALNDPSGRPIPGRIYGKKVKVGQNIVVTVDPRGKIPPSTGRRPTGSRTFLAAGVSAAAEILFLAWAAFRGTAERLAAKATDEPERTQEPEDSPA